MRHPLVIAEEHIEHVPSGNETWQLTILHLRMMFPWKPLLSSVYRGFPLAMVFDYRRELVWNKASPFCSMC